MDACDNDTKNEAPNGSSSNRYDENFQSQPPQEMQEEEPSVDTFMKKKEAKYCRKRIIIGIEDEKKR